MIWNDTLLIEKGCFKKPFYWCASMIYFLMMHAGIYSLYLCLSYKKGVGDIIFSILTIIAFGYLTSLSLLFSFRARTYVRTFIKNQDGYAVINMFGEKLNFHATDIFSVCEEPKNSGVDCFLTGRRRNDFGFRFFLRNGGDFRVGCDMEDIKSLNIMLKDDLEKNQGAIYT